MTRIPGTHPRVRLEANCWLVFVHGTSVGDVKSGHREFVARSWSADATAFFPSRAAAVRWLVAQYDATLPTAAALAGSVPDLTGEQTTEDYIATIRG